MQQYAFPGIAVSGAFLSTDVVVAGGGVIGLCTALALSQRHLTVTLIGEPTAGEASRAAAGMLAPSVESHAGNANDFGIAARDRYPSYLEFLADRTGITVPLNRRGILQVALSTRGVKGLRRWASPRSRWLESNELAELEPSLSHALGAVHNPDDGAVDNVALVNALSAAVAANERITVRRGRISRVKAGGKGVSSTTVEGDSISAGHVIIAAGAWSSLIEGARYARAIVPAKGQLIAYHTAPLNHVVYGPRGYLVPRGTTTIGGSTTENTGFDSSTSEKGIERVRSAAAEICPSLASLRVSSAWAGLRPITSDTLPLLGPDAENPSIIYACGHGRNGILMAPLTGDVVADLVTGSPLPYDLGQFRADRL